MNENSYSDRWFRWSNAMICANRRALKTGIRHQVRRIPDNWIDPVWEVTEAGPREV